MRSTITADIDVDVPVDVAYNQWTQFETFSDFMSAVDRVDQLDSTHTHWRVHLGNVDREFDAVIVEQMPDDHIAWQSTDGTMHMGLVHFEPIDDRHTHVKLSMSWEPESFVERAGAWLQMDDREVARDLREFKRMIEERGMASGAWRGTVIDSGVVPMTEDPHHVAEHRTMEEDMSMEADTVGEGGDMDVEIEREVDLDDIDEARLHLEEHHDERRDDDPDHDDGLHYPDGDFRPVR